MEYAILETNHTPTLIFCSSRAKQNAGDMIVKLKSLRNYRVASG